MQAMFPHTVGMSTFSRVNIKKTIVERYQRARAPAYTCAHTFNRMIARRGKLRAALGLTKKRARAARASNPEHAAALQSMSAAAAVVAVVAAAEQGKGKKAAPTKENKGKKKA